MDSSAILTNSSLEWDAQDGWSTLNISVASTFTCNPIEDTLRFWGQKFGYKTTLNFSPYDQVFQELMDPTSSLNHPSQDARVLLLRIDDWVRNLPDTGQLSLYSHIVANIHDLKTFAAMAMTFVDTPLFVCIARNSKTTRIHPECHTYYEQFIKNELSTYTNIHVTTSEDFDNMYCVEDYYDAQKDQLGHIPFKRAYFTALATTVFRKVLASKRAPYKVIVLDCDHTLWGGVCGEVPPNQLDLSYPYVYLQAFMLMQKASGKILCLCSKNVKEDVDKVFLERRDLPLRKEDLVRCKINWQPKSRNLKELSEELNLGLDSFIFIDDNPVECAEVRANCPEVITLNLPEKPEKIREFLNHAWVFDTLTTTGEDTKRTQLYKENAERTGFKESSSSLKEFIDGLKLEIRISEAIPEELSRVSQLSYRTNQFNFTTIRRSEVDIEKLLGGNGFNCKVCRVKDRFGDYGLVGVMLYKLLPSKVIVDTFMLSCRVLGRGVEYSMLRSVGETARARGSDIVIIKFRHTEKNLPAWNFLQSVIEGNSENISLTDDGFEIPTEYLTELTYDPDTHNSRDQKSNGLAKKPRAIAPIQYQGHIFEMIAKELHHPSKIDELVHAGSESNGWKTSVSSASLEKDPLQLITNIWMNILDRDKIGPDEHFFDIGGTSLKAVEVLSQLNEQFNKNLTIVSLFEHSTIRSLVDLFENKKKETSEFDKVIERAGSRRNHYKRSK